MQKGGTVPSQAKKSTNMASITITLTNLNKTWSGMLELCRDREAKVCRDREAKVCRDREAKVCRDSREGSSKWGRGQGGLQWGRGTS